MWRLTTFNAQQFSDCKQTHESWGDCWALSVSDVWTCCSTQLDQQPKENACCYY